MANFSNNLILFSIKFFISHSRLNTKDFVSGN